MDNINDKTVDKTVDKTLLNNDVKWLLDETEKIKYRNGETLEKGKDYVEKDFTEKVAAAFHLTKEEVEMIIKKIEKDEKQQNKSENEQYRD